MIKPTYGTTPQMWAAADRRIAIVLKRHSGQSFASIGRELGISSKTVSHQFQIAMESRVVRWAWLERMRVFNERMRQRVKGVA